MCEDSTTKALSHRRYSASQSIFKMTFSAESAELFEVRTEVRRGSANRLLRSGVSASDHDLFDGGLFLHQEKSPEIS